MSALNDSRAVSSADYRGGFTGVAFAACLKLFALIPHTQTDWHTQTKHPRCLHLSKYSIPELLLQEAFIPLWPYSHVLSVLFSPVDKELCDACFPVSYIHTHSIKLYTQPPTSTGKHHPYSISLTGYIILLVSPPQSDRDRLSRPLIAAVATVMGNGAAHLHLLILLLWWISWAPRQLFMVRVQCVFWGNAEKDWGHKLKML